MAADLAAVLAAHVSLELMNRRRLRPADYIQSDGLMSAAAKTLDPRDTHNRHSAHHRASEKAGQAPGRQAFAYSKPHRLACRLRAALDQPSPRPREPMLRRWSLVTWCPCHMIPRPAGTRKLSIRWGSECHSSTTCRGCEYLTTFGYEGRSPRRGLPRKTQRETDSGSCKPSGNSRIWPDKKGGGLQDGSSVFNGIAQSLIGYRYTIPQWITQCIQ